MRAELDHDPAAISVAPCSDVYDVLGHRVCIRGSTPAVRATIAHVFRGFGPVAPDAAALVSAGTQVGPPCYELVAAGSAWEVRAADATMYSGPDLAAALAALESLTIGAALVSRPDSFHLHAAALCLPTRLEGLAIAGDSGLGKTTLAVTLMLRGFLPFSDDVAVLDAETLGLSPLRRAFHLTAHSRALIAEAAGAGIGWDERDPAGVFCPPQFAERPAPLRWLLFLERRPGSMPELTPLSPSETAMAVLTHTVGLAEKPRQALTLCGRIAAGVRCFRFVTGDLAASASAVERLVAAGL